MTTIFKHQNPHYRLLDWATRRKEELNENISQMQLEVELMESIIASVKKEVCQDCSGAGHVMKPIKGCECDGPRMHTCETCNGSGALIHTQPSKE